MKYTCSVATGPIDGLGFDAPLDKKKDSMKRFADTYIHSGWQQ
jgi:hypothetical protein